MSGPVHIIGAGINGLVAAADLAARGRKVQVWERGPTPGGAVQTKALTLPGFHHDVAAMNLSMFAGSGFMARHGEEMARHGLELVSVDRPFAQAMTPGDFVGVSTDINETLASFHSEQDKDTWQSLMREFPEKAAVIGGLLGTPMTRTALLKFVWRQWRSLGLGKMTDIARLLMTSPRDWLQDTFEDPRLHCAFSTWGLHLDFAPDVAGGAIFPFLEALGGQAQGMVIGKGGAATVTDALVRMIEAHGGSITCDADVRAISHTHGTVTGLSVNGEDIAAETVLAGLAPRHLSTLIGDSGHARFDAGLDAFRHAPGTMMIHLALDGPVPWAAPELGRFAYVHVGQSIDATAQTYQQAMAGLLPDRPVLVVGQPSVFDPTRAPEGKQTLWVQVRVLPADIAGDAKGKISARDWDQAKAPFAARVIDQLEEQAPGVRDRILAQTVVSPRDLEAGNPNLVGGDQLCGSHHLRQNFLFRPVRGFADGTTPIKGLHMIGAAVWPGAGTGAGSGFFKAQDL